MRSLWWLLLLPALAWAQSEVQMEIRSGEIFRIPILVAPLEDAGGERGREVEEALRSDLVATDLFLVYAGTRESGWVLLEEEAVGTTSPRPQALVTGRVRGDRLEGRLEDFASGEEIFSREYAIRPGMVRWAAHAFADDIVRYLTGLVGIARTRILFVARRGGASDLYLVDWDGRRLARVTELSSLVVSPTWDPEARRIAFTSYHLGRPAVVGVDLRGGGLWTITQEPGLNSAPAWSPGGDRLAVVLSHEGNAEIYVMNPDGTHRRRLTHHPGIDTAPCWSPDGRRLAFTSDRSGRPQIYVMDADGTNLRRVTFWGFWNDSPDWSPTGDRLVYAGYAEGSFDLYLIGTDGSGLRRLTRHPGDCENPRWAPDGRHVVYSRREGDQRRLWILDVETLRERALTPEDWAAYNPAWSRPLDPSSIAARWMAPVGGPGRSGTGKQGGSSGERR
jgi:TolB protein